MTGWRPGDPLYSVLSMPFGSVQEIRFMFELIPDHDCTLTPDVCGSPKSARWPEPFPDHYLDGGVS